MRSGRFAMVVAVCLALATGCGASSTSTARSAPSPTPVSYHGVEPEPVPSRPEFVLRDTAGNRFDFGAQTRGRPTYVYFGYTHCPDECPTAMADLAAALRKAPTPGARVVFVTTDPRRDTPAVLRRWLDRFSPTFVGLLGTPAQVAAAQQAVGVTVASRGPALPTVPGHPDLSPDQAASGTHVGSGPLGYSVQHSAVIFAYDAADRLPVLYPGGVTPSDIAADLPVLTDPPRSTP